MKHSKMAVYGVLSYVIAFLLTLAAVGLAGCRAPEDLGSNGAATSEFEPLSHPPGTLLKDARGKMWMVQVWPERSFVTPQTMQRMHLTATDAVPLALAEEQCLRVSGRLWNGERSYVLARLANGEMWYVDHARWNRRAARPEIIRAWRDDPAHPEAVRTTVELFRRQYQDMGPMPPPDGTIIRTEDGIYDLFGGEMHRFESEDLARNVGFHVDAAIRLTTAALSEYGELGAPLTEEFFLQCPLAHHMAEQYDDWDGDGFPRSRDCDDHSAARAPGFVEICDGLDNNCNGTIDEGFNLGASCDMRDDCHTTGVMSCGYDGWSVECRNDNAEGCEN